MFIMKFGGTSVGSAANHRVARELVRTRLEQRPIVVVSALAGVTNRLVEYARMPAQRGAIAAEIVRRHRELASELEIAPLEIAPALDAWEAVHARFAANAAALHGADADEVLGFGEWLSAVLFAAGLRAQGIEAIALRAGDAGLVTDEHFGAAHPLPESARLLRERLEPLRQVPVITGFLGRTLDGRTTTLGRGGSDYSAAILGAALAATRIEIWTDTSGLLSADPRIVPEARPVPRLSFAEASELAYFGAKVLHPKTLLPAIEHDIPVAVLNTARPGDPGSLITPAADPAESAWRVKSIASKSGISAVTIASTRMLLAHGFLARVFEVFGRHRIVVDLVTTSEVSISVTLDDPSRLPEALPELEAIGRVEVRHGLAVVAVVGEGAPRRVGLPGHVFTLLGGVGIGIEMISQGASRVNLSFVVAEEDADRAVRLLHRGLGLDADVATDAARAGVAKA